MFGPYCWHPQDYAGSSRHVACLTELAKSRAQLLDFRPNFGDAGSILSFSEK